MGAKELGQAYDKTEQVMEIMKSYATRPSVLPFFTSTLEKSLGQSCGLPMWFTRFIHLQKRYLQTKEPGHWEYLWIPLRDKPSQSKNRGMPRMMMQAYSQVSGIDG